MKYLMLMAAAVSMAACSLNVPGPEDHPTDPATETFASNLGVSISTMTKTANGVYYKDVTVGSGTKVLTGNQQLITFAYSGYLKDGTLFQSSTTPNGVLVSSLIPGLQEGLQGMLVGGDRLLVVPSALGYGPYGAGSIPPNATLVFRIRINDMS